MDVIGRPGRVLAEVASDVVTRAVHARAAARRGHDGLLAEPLQRLRVGPTRWNLRRVGATRSVRHALGRFRDLLRATAQSRRCSTGPRQLPQYGTRRARTDGRMQAQQELRARADGAAHARRHRRRLHANDVQELARVFTGWTIAPQRSGHRLVFVPWLHDGGVRRAFGHPHRAGRPGAEGRACSTCWRAGPRRRARGAEARALRRRRSPETLVQRTKRRLAAHRRRPRRGDAHDPRGRTSCSQRRAVTAKKVKSPLELLASALRSAHADVRQGNGRGEARRRPRPADPARQAADGMEGDRRRGGHRGRHGPPSTSRRASPRTASPASAPTLRAGHGSRAAPTASTRSRRDIPARPAVGGHARGAGRGARRRRDTGSARGARAVEPGFQQ